MACEVPRLPAKQHVALDSNAIIPNYSMRGSRLSALFDFARRTESELILFEAVRQEILANYKRTLTSFSKEAQDAWWELQGLLESSNHFDSPDLSYEMDAMERRLRNPQTGIQFKTPEIPVDATEIVRRGAYRIKPANENGEELRDVIVWLCFLEYVKDDDLNYAFISADRGFWSKTGLHQEIEHDIATAGKKIKMYRTIEEFLKDQDIPSRQLTETELLGLLKQTNLSERVTRAVSVEVTSGWKTYTAGEGKIETLKVVSATLYDVSKDHRLIEAALEVSIIFPVRQKESSHILFSGNFKISDQIYPPPRYEDLSLPISTSFSLYEPMPLSFASAIRVRGTLSVSARLLESEVKTLDPDSFEVETVEQLRSGVIS